MVIAILSPEMLPVMSVWGKAIDAGNDRPSMGQWLILVLGTSPLNCDWGFDKTLKIENFCS